MKIKFCALVAIVLSLLGSELHAGNLKVNLTPAQAASAGAQWRVDGGSWRNSGTTATNLSNATHVVSYKAVNGWITSANANVTLSNGVTTTLTGTYVSPASLKINLTPTTGRWRIDGGSWQTPGATVSGLTPGSHGVEYQAVSGFNAPAAENVTLSAGQSTTLTRAYIQLAQLTVTLSPSTGQWRIDGGAWRNSGTTATGLTPGAHTLEFNAVSGYNSPVTESISLAAGQALTLNRAYVTLSKLSITLAPTTGKWRVDGGTWQASGALVSNLTPGSHNVDYQAVSGFNAPAAESVTLVSGQTTTLTRAYTQLAQLKVTLTPSTGQWRIDGGAWRTSGTTLTGLNPGAHTLEFAAVSGFSTPPSESVSLAAGQSLTLIRTYTALSKLSITLAPTTGKWRVDGGAWLASGVPASNLTPGNHSVDYQALAGFNAPSSETVSLISGQTTNLTRAYVQLAQLSITLSPTSGQWRIDGGAWLASGAVAGNLAPGNHTVDYQPLAGFTAPSSETISLSPGQSAVRSRAYVQLAQLTINLDPASGQWRVDDGAWQSSGAALSLPSGSYSIEYSELVDFDTPPGENITLAAGDSFTASRSYISQRATLRVTLTTPINGPWHGQWRIDGGAWRNSGTMASDLAVGAHTVDYTDIGGPYLPLASETVTLGLYENATLTRAYVLKPPASLTVTLNPTAAQWRVDGGAWQASGATVGNLQYDLPFTIDYAPAFGFVPPPSESVTLASGQSLALNRSYVPLTQISITLTPSTGQWIGQWRVDGGDWQVSGAAVTDLTPGSHTISYLPLPVYADYQTPSDETVNLVAGQSLTLSRAYAKLAAFYVILNPTAAQWRIDGGVWTAGGIDFPRYSLSLGTHLVEYSVVPGYVTPPAESVTLVAGANPPLTRNYTPLASFGVILTPASAQWRIDGGAWNASGVTLTGLALGAHTVEYSTVPGYMGPPPDSITLVSGTNPPRVRIYIQLASVHVTTVPAFTQWRIDGGSWQMSGSTTVNNLAIGVPHTVEFNDLLGYVTPPAQTFTLSAGELREVTASYQKLASVHVTTAPASTQWRIDSGPWQMSGSTIINNLAFGVPHTVEFNDLLGYVTPAAQTITLAPGELREVTASYQKLASVHVTTVPASTQWRIDSGPWQMSGSTTINNLAFGVPHTVEFNDLLGYVTPPAQTITLTVGELREVTASYQKLASVHVTTVPATTQWRIDGGPWQMSGSTTINNLTFDVPHIVEFNELPGYVIPAAQTITLAAGELREITASYQKLASVHVTTVPGSSQWRIDGGPWQMSGSTTVNNLAFGVPHTVEFNELLNYGTPAAQSVTLLPGELREVTASYTQLASLSVSLNLSVAMWRVDGATWNASGVSVYLTPGAHTIEFSRHEGYFAPLTETLTLSGTFNSQSRTYAPDPAFSIDPSLAKFTVILDPKFAEWRLDGGDWNISGASLHNLSLGTHGIDYKAVADYITPPAESVTLAAGTNPTLYTDYISIDPAQLTVTTTPGTGQWRAYPYLWPASGTWQASGATVTGLNPGAYTIEYAPLAGYIPPVPGYVDLLPDGSRSLSASYYVINASVKVLLTPATARYRINGGVWRVGNGMSWIGISPGTYPLEFEPVAGYIAPAATTITLGPGQSKEYTFTYTPQ